MRKRRLGSFLLALVMVVSLLAPSILTMPVQADGETETDPSNGMVYNKTAVSNGKGGYTITLEAYATGSKFTSETSKDVPTDIILVLDQSGSMKQKFVKHEESSFKPYEDQTNANLYDKRHNGGAENLYHKLDGNAYVSVSVEVELGGVNYTKTSSACTDLYGSRESLYVYNKVTNEYQKVEAVFDLSKIGTSNLFSFYVEGKLVAHGGAFLISRYPTFDDKTTYDSFYIAEYNESLNVYTYSYTDETGTHILGSSTGAGASFDGPLLYELIPGGDIEVTRLEALKSAVNVFQSTVAKKATSANVDHRIAVVGFACSNTGNDSSYNNFQNTEILIDGKGFKYGTEANTNASQAFQNMSTSAGVDNVKNSINALDANGATYVNHGLELANTIFANDPKLKEDGRKRVVIVFTDGVPGYSGFDSDVANSAIIQADQLRSTYKADVYTVGIFDGADATSGGNASGNDTQKANWFMQRMSNNLGSPRTPSYYLSANDSTSLTNIFQKIAQNIESGGSSTTLDGNTVIKDLVSDYFQLPAGTTSDKITVTTVPCTAITDGKPVWGTAEPFGGATVEVNPATGDVSVTGFDFAANYVGMDSISGKEQLHNPAKMLRISFDVVPKDGLLGGSGVPTNTSAGIYENSNATNPVITFNQPTVDIPIGEVTVTPEAKNVYLLGNVSAETLKSGATVTVGGVSLNLSEENYGLESWQYEYVNITVEVKDAGGNVISGDLAGLTGDSTYSITVTVSPKTGDTVDAQTGTGNGTINVFKPVLTYQDSSVYYGDDVPTNFSGNLASTKWKHGDTVATDTGVSMIGTAPELSTAYSVAEGSISNGLINTKQDIPVYASVKIGEVDVTEHVAFNHNNCEGKTCTLPTGSKFLLHVNTCQLIISKTGGADGEPYVFNVLKGGDKYSEVTIVGNNSATIVELPVGTYTIQEDADWSWRYAPSYSDNVTLDKDHTTGTINCTNSLNKLYWLNGFSDVVKNIFGVKH